MRQAIVVLLVVGALASPTSFGQSTPLRIEASPGWVSVQRGSVTPFQFSIYNDYREPLAWSATVTASDGQEWMSISPASGTLPAKINNPDNRVTVTLSCNAANKATNRYTATLIARSPVSPDCTRELVVDVRAEGRFSIWPTSVWLDGHQATQQLSLMNVGPVPLYNWQVTVTKENGDPFPAVTVSPSSGLSIPNTSPSNEEELTFSADASGLAVGYYNVKAVVDASNLNPQYSPFVIPVTLRVSQPVLVDELHINTATPPAGTNLYQDLPLQFRVEAAYRLASQPAGLIELQLYDQSTNLLASSDAVSVTRSAERQTLTLTLPAAGQELRLGTNVTQARFRALLWSGSTLLRQTDFIQYPVFGAGIKRLELGTLLIGFAFDYYEDNKFAPFSQTPAWLPTFKVLAQSPDGIPKAVRVTYDLPGNDPGTVKLVLMAQDHQGKWTRGYSSRGVTAESGTDQSVIELLPSSYVIAAGTTTLRLGVVLERDGHSPVYSQPIDVPIADVRVVPLDPPNYVQPEQLVFCNFQLYATNPTATPFTIWVAVHSDYNGMSMSSDVLPGASITGPKQCAATVMRWVNAEWHINRGLDSGTRVPLWHIKALPSSTAIHFPASPTAQSAELFQATLSVFTPDPLDTICIFQPQSLASLLPLGAPLRNSPGLTALDLAWQFSPSIPENGTLQGVLTLDYSRAPLPDFPGFVETNLQVVSCDESGTGQLRTYPTVIDPVAHTASVSIHGLAPLYSVAIVSPSGSGPAILPMLSGSSDIRTRLAWVNLAGAPVEVLERAFEHDGYLYQESGITNPATRLLAPGQQVTAQAQDLFGLGWLPWDGWIEAYPTASGSLAFELLEASGDVELIPAACASACDLVLPGLTLDGLTTTQLEILNPANVGREVELQLRGESAQPLAVRKHWLNPKSKLASTVPDLFPETTLTGNAHLFLQTDGPLMALAILRSPGAISVVDAQPFRSEPGTNIFHLPLFRSASNATAATTLTLLNASTNASALQIAARTSTGTLVAPPLALPLSPRHQTNLDLALFGNTAAYLQVTAIGGALSGHARFHRTGQTDTPVAVLALSPASAKNWLCTLFTGSGETNWQPQVALHNPGTVSSKAVVICYTSAGRSIGSADFTVAPRATSTQVVRDLVAPADAFATAYVTIASEVPVVVASFAGSVNSSAFTILPARAFTATQPQLTVQSLDGQIQLGWPAASLDYRLESSASLNAGAAWVAVPGEPSLQTDHLQWRVPTGATSQFYRLIQVGGP